VLGLGILLNGVPECLVSGNRIDGLAVSLLGAGLTGATIGANHCFDTLVGFMLQGARVDLADNQTRSGFIGIAVLSGSDISVSGTRIEITDRLEIAQGVGILLREVSGARVSNNRIRGPWSGIMLAGCRQPELRGNELTDIGFTGISVQAGEDPRILTNRIRRCGSLQYNGAIGIGLGGTGGSTVEIDGNEVRELGLGRPGGAPPASTGILASILRDCHARDNDVEVGSGRDPAQQVGISLVCGRYAEVVGNAIRSPGHSPLIRIIGIFKGWSGVICSTNRATQEANDNVGLAPVRVAAAHASLMGNQVRSGPTVPPVDLQGTGRLAAVGNITSNGNWVGVPANLLPQPLAGFNHLVF
jgi:parallel beta-helix repeat protein